MSLFFKIFKKESSSGKITEQSISETELNLAKKSYLTHDLEDYFLKEEASNIVNRVKCKKCNHEYFAYKRYPKINFLPSFDKNGISIEFSTCDENIIKNLLE